MKYIAKLIWNLAVSSVFASSALAEDAPSRCILYGDSQAERIYFSSQNWGVHTIDLAISNGGLTYSTLAQRSADPQRDLEKAYQHRIKQGDAVLISIGVNEDPNDEERVAGLLNQRLKEIQSRGAYPVFIEVSVGESWGNFLPNPEKARDQMNGPFRERLNQVALDLGIPVIQTHGMGFGRDSEDLHYDEAAQQVIWQRFNRILTHSSLGGFSAPCP